MQMLKRGVAALLVAMLVLALVGCAQIAQQATKAAVENATGVKVDQNGQKVTVTDKNGQTSSISTDQNKLPDGLPSDVPAYSGTITAATKLDAPDTGTTYQFTVTTTDDAATVQSWYKDQLASKGWKITGTVTSGDQAMVNATKTDKNNILVTIGKNSSDGKTEVNTVADFKK